MPRHVKPEDKIHMQLVASLRLAQIPCFHPPNGLPLPKAKHAAARIMNRFKRLGLSPGVPDIIIPMGPPNFPRYRAAAIEVKAPGEKPRASQEKWLADLEALGWLTYVCDDYGRGLAVLLTWGYPVRHIGSFECSDLGSS